MNRHAKENAGMAGFAGLVLIIYGFGFGGIGVYTDHGAFYEFLIRLYNWTIRYGGFALLAAAGVCFTGLRIGLLIDAVVSGLIGGILVLCVGGWFFYERSFDVTNIVVVLIALMLLRSAYANFLLWNASAGERPPSRPAPSPSEAPPIHIASGVLPKEGEPPPPEGYLAALAREKEESSKANYE